MSECYPIVNIWCKYQPFEPTIMRLFEFDGWGNIPFTTFLFCFLSLYTTSPFFPYLTCPFSCLFSFLYPPVLVLYIYIYIYIFFIHLMFLFLLLCFLLFCSLSSLHIYLLFFLFYFFISFLSFSWLSCFSSLLLFTILINVTLLFLLCFFSDSPHFPFVVPFLLCAFWFLSPFFFSTASSS